ncbi:MAG: response regulator [Alphaproteobacteria bacterium]
MAHIIIVDDDASMLSFLSTALEKEGHTVQKFNFGPNALKVIENGDNIDLLLTDIVMPGMDGIELSKKALALNPALKTMFITGFIGSPVSPQTTLKTGHQVISKTFSLKRPHCTD